MKEEEIGLQSSEKENQVIEPLSRRNFLRLGSIAALGSVFLPKIALGTSPLKPPPVCQITSPDIIGPYYLAGAPLTNQIADAGDAGTRLFMTGTVYGPDCVTPIPGALLDIWQADDAGVYDMTSGYNLRGKVLADSNGNYAYETIMPGLYLNGATYRPRHIHLKGSAIGFQSLTTQLYFEGDPYIAADPWASLPESAMRILTITTDGGGANHGVFDVVLDSVNSVEKYKPFSELGFLLQNYPNPFSAQTLIRFGIFRRMEVNLSIYDMNGLEVKRLIDQVMNPGRFTSDWDGKSDTGYALPNGVYICNLLMDGKKEFSIRMIIQR